MLDIKMKILHLSVFIYSTGLLRKKPVRCSSWIPTKFSWNLRSPQLKNITTFLPLLRRTSGQGNSKSRMCLPAHWKKVSILQEWLFGISRNMNHNRKEQLFSMSFGNVEATWEKATFFCFLSATAVIFRITLLWPTVSWRSSSHQRKMEPWILCSHVAFVYALSLYIIVQVRLQKGRIRIISILHTPSDTSLVTSRSRMPMVFYVTLSKTVIVASPTALL